MFLTNQGGESGGYHRTFGLRPRVYPRMMQGTPDLARFPFRKDPSAGSPAKCPFRARVFYTRIDSSPRTRFLSPDCFHAPKPSSDSKGVGIGFRIDHLRGRVRWADLDRRVHLRSRRAPDKQGHLAPCLRHFLNNKSSAAALGGHARKGFDTWTIAHQGNQGSGERAVERTRSAVYLMVMV